MDIEHIAHSGDLCLDEGSGRTWEIVGPTKYGYVLCLGEPAPERDADVRVFAPLDLLNWSHIGRVQERFARYRREGHVEVCIHCGACREGTAAFSIKHQGECLLAAAYARGITALAEQTMTTSTTLIQRAAELVIALGLEHTGMTAGEVRADASDCVSLIIVWTMPGERLRNPEVELVICRRTDHLETYTQTSDRALRVNEAKQVSTLYARVVELAERIEALR